MYRQLGHDIIFRGQRFYTTSYLTLHPKVPKYEITTLHFSYVTVPLTLLCACECGLASQMLQFRPQSHSLRSQTLFCFNLRIMICAECCILLRPNSLACQSVTAVSTTWISSPSVLGGTRIVYGNTICQIDFFGGIIQTRQRHLTNSRDVNIVTSM